MIYFLTICAFCRAPIKGDLSIFKNEALVLLPFDIIIHLAGAIFAKNREEYYRKMYIRKPT